MKCEVFGNPAQSAPIHKTLLPDCLPHCPPQKATGTAGFGFDTAQTERQILPQPICILNIHIVQGAAEETQLQIT